MTAETVVAATLVYNTPALADAMRAQLPDVWIIDNGSEPSIEGSQISIASNRYFSGGWSDAMTDLRIMGAEWVWMLNSDVTGVSPAMLAGLVEIAQAWYDVHGLAVLTPAFNSPHDLFWHHEGETRAVRPVPWVDWCCPLVSVAAWERVGGFDERFAGYGADLDWCWRARQHGYMFGVSDRWQVVHQGGATAIPQGLAGITHDVGAMDAALFDKWGRHWWEMAHGT